MPKERHPDRDRQQPRFSRHEEAAPPAPERTAGTPDYRYAETGYDETGYTEGSYQETGYDTGAPQQPSSLPPRSTGRRAAAASYADRYSESYDDEPKKGRTALMAVAMIGVAVAGAAGWFMVKGASQHSSGGASSSGGAPIISADSNPYKVKPTDPGGMLVPNQDKTVYERLNPADGEGSGDVEKLLPEPGLPTAPPAPPPPELVVPAAPPLPPALPPGSIASAGTGASSAAPAPQPSQPLALKAPTGVPAASNSDGTKEVAAPKVNMVPSPSAATPQNATTPAAPVAAPVTTPAKTTPAPAVPTATTPPVAKTAALAPATGSFSATPTAPTAAKTPAVPPTTTPAPAKASSGGSFSVQLASVKDEDAAQKTWQQLQSKYPSQLGGLSLSVVKVDLGEKGVFYRVRGAGLPSEERARQVCADLTKEKVGCLFVGK